jgi:Uma2 family endonuclease
VAEAPPRTIRWNVSDLELFPDDGRRREIIDGELFVSTQPHFYHQQTSGNLMVQISRWNDHNHLGTVVQAPGVIFSPEDAVAPDVIWVGRERLVGALDSGGHLHVAPELVVEVLSPGAANERRDQEAKLKLYSLRGVREYWIADWRQRLVIVFRREGSALALAGTFYEGDTLEAPLLPGFQCPVSQIFADIPREVAG